MNAMKQFCISCIQPIIMYAGPSWFSMLSNEQQQQLERIENLELKVLDLQSTHYEESVSRNQMTQILELPDHTSKQYIGNTRLNGTKW